MNFWVQSELSARNIKENFVWRVNQSEIDLFKIEDKERIYLEETVKSFRIV